MNFIVILSLIANDYDYLLIVTNKFFKRVLIISEKTIYNITK